MKLHLRKLEPRNPGLRKLTRLKHAISRITALVSLLTLLGALATPVMLPSDCHRMTSTCEHCHPPATSLQTTPLCCSASQSLPSALPTAAITLEAQASPSSQVPILTLPPPKIHPTYIPNASAPPPLSPLVLRI